jgi:membrane protease subunit HflK
MSDHDHHDDPHAPETQDSGSQALSEALHSSFVIVQVAMVALVVIILGLGVFRVHPGEKAVVLRFGRPLEEGQEMLKSPGRLYWSLPYPIDEVVRIPIAEIQQVTSSVGWYAMTHQEEVAFDSLGVEPPAAGSLNPRDGYVFTADRNIIHTRATVSYHIEDPLRAIFHFAAGTNQEFNLAGVSNAVQNAANNALVATAARYNVDDILTRDPAGFQAAVERRINELVESEQLGVVIDPGQCQVRSEAPRQLRDVFAEVTKARQKRETLISDALGQQKRILSEAGANASSITNAAESARVRYVTSIQSDAEAFTKLLPQYETNPKLFCELELTKTLSMVLTNVGEKKILPTRAGGKSVELRLMLNNEPPQPKSAANP